MSIRASAARTEAPEHEASVRRARRGVSAVIPRAMLEHLRVVHVTTSDAIIGADTGGSIAYLNPAAERLFGRRATDSLGLPVTILVPGRLRDTYRSGVSQLLAAAPSRAVELVAIRADGLEFPIELSLSAETVAEPRLFIGIVRDLSVHKRLEQTARACELRYHQVVELIRDGICVSDASGTITFANHRMEQLLGYGSGAMVGLEISELLASDERATAAPDTEVRPPRTAGETTLRLRHTGGREVRVRFSSRPTRTPDGLYAGLTSSVVDLTDIKRDEAEVRAVDARSSLRDGLSPVGTFAAGVAHEINNPLASVSADLELLAQRLRAMAHGALPAPASEWDDLLELIDEARDGADRIKNFVADLKSLARTTPGTRKVIDVRHSLDAAIDTMSNELHQRARVVTEYGAIPPVKADAARLGQVFVHLLVNAAQAIAEGDADHNEIRVVTSTDPYGRAVVEVRDTGCGIPAEILPRIFDPFFTTKPVGSATGLGLSICRAVVTALSGRIEVESEDRSGSVLRVILPAAKFSRPIPRITSSQPEAARVAGRILIVDDDALVRSALGKVLSEHRTTLVATGRAALELLRKDSAFDIVLCDLMMPEMTGMELYQQLCAELPAVTERMVFVTGGAVTQAAQQFLDDVPNERIDKPFELPTLRAVIQRFLR